MTRILLIRHGETDWNIEGRYQGQSDIPLNENGMQQARLLAAKIAHEDISAVYSSDLIRTRGTAQALADAQGVSVQIDTRLREIGLGVWEGMVVGDIQTQYKDMFEERRRAPAHFAPPGGETTTQFLERLLRAVNEIAARHPNQTVAVVTHGFAVAVLLTHFRKTPIQQVWHAVPNNGEINEIQV